MFAGIMIHYYFCLDFIGAIKITFWTIISLAATVGLTWNGYHIISQYLSFGVSVSVSMHVLPVI